MNAKAKIYISLFSLLYMSSTQAFEVAAEFSAEAVQSAPGRPPVVAKMFVSKKAVRTESNMAGHSMVEIIYPDTNRRILLNSVSKTFIEQTTPNNQVNKNKQVKNSPCAQMSQASCKKLKTETINGRKTVKWEMTVNMNGRQAKSLHWLDKKYHMPIREQFQDGTITTLTFTGKEKLDKRNVEKWQFLATRPNGQKVESQQWYDPKLKMVIKEMLAGGYIRELRNIKVAKQDKKLFKVPADFKKEVMPVMGRGMPPNMNMNTNPGVNRGMPVPPRAAPRVNR